MMALSITTLLIKGIAGIVSPVRTDGALPPDGRERARLRAERIRQSRRQRMAEPSPQDLADINGTSKWRRPWKRQG